MSLFNDITALAIASGYSLGLYLLWSARSTMNVVSSLAWVLFPAMGLWIVFYLAVPLTGGMPNHQQIFVALARVAHSFSIATLIVAGLVARKIDKGGG